MDPATDGSMRLDPERLHAALRESQVLTAKAQQAIARARAARHQARRGRVHRKESDDSALARLAAKQQTMPVIEQAKGIIMAQQRCGPEEAFDLLRRASQQANIKAQVLAAQIVGAHRLQRQRRQRDTHHAGCHTVPAAGNAGTATRRVKLTRLRGRRLDPARMTASGAAQPCRLAGLNPQQPGRIRSDPDGPLRVRGGTMAPLL